MSSKIFLSRDVANWVSRSSRLHVLTRSAGLCTEFTDKISPRIDPDAIEVDDVVAHILAFVSSQEIRRRDSLYQDAQRVLDSYLENRPFPRRVFASGIPGNEGSVFYEGDFGNHLGWIFFSNELLHRHHFRRADRPDVIMATGPFQLNNLLTDQTRLGIHVDNDPKQVVLSILFGGLAAAYPNSGKLMYDFLNLTVNKEALLGVVREAAYSGVLPSERHLLIEELSQRIGSFSLLAFYGTYERTFRKILSGDSLEEEEKANFEWLLDSNQYDIVHRMQREGRILEYQADLQKDVSTIANDLRDRQETIGSLYLSNIQDMWCRKGKHRDWSLKLQRLVQLAGVVRCLPFQNDTVIQWTSDCGLPGIVTPKPSKRMDFLGISIPNFTYIEMPHRMFFEWLLTQATEPENLLRFLHQKMDQGEVSVEKDKLTFNT